MKSKKGFTLIELMVVMAIIAVLSVLIIGAIQIARRTSIETTNRGNLRNVQTALEGKYAKYQRYCGTNTDEIACGTAMPASFDSVKTALGVTLTDTCSTATSNKGGGRITSISATSVTLVARDYNCNDTTGSDVQTLTIP